jgi:predicted nucleotidyltransferase component of viral defense system
LLLKSKGIITDLQREILIIFSEIPDSKMFYLTGGTALAEFYLGHRRSFDLDIFTTEKGLIIPFSYVFEQEVKKIFSLKQ